LSPGRACRAALLPLLLLAVPDAARGQRNAPAGAAPAHRTTDAPQWSAVAAMGAGIAPDTTRRRHASWWAPLASAVVPGSGQAMLGQDRFVGYLALEAYGWMRFVVDRREGERQRESYRRLARRVARAYYPGDHPDGDFEYYERMQHWVESGVFDLVPGGEIEPEIDTSTFNGAAWLLARQTFWEDPDAAPPAESSAYRDAMDFYTRRAVRSEYRWSWRNAQLEQDLFARTIARSNTAFRRSIQDVGLLTANHVLSTVDAYVTVRLRRGDAGSFGFEAAVPWAPFGRPSISHVPSRARR
jgi:hypothetical protein